MVKKMTTKMASYSLMARIILLCISSLLATSVQAKTLTSSVDRTTVSAEDLITLTVNYDAQVNTGPNFSTLTQNFSVLRNSQRSGFSYNNGKSSSWTQWTITLLPLHSGKLTIPALSFRGVKSDPITINVGEKAVSQNKQSEDAYFVVEVDKSKAYVQGQIIYTERLYNAVRLEHGRLNAVKAEDSVIEPLGETRSYQTRINNRVFDVHERKFAIYPQISGELLIPGPIYDGEVSNGPYRPGRPIRISHKPTKIEVIPQPADYPQASWLPAESIAVAYKWKGDPKSLIAGEPATLQLTLKAVGLSSAQLPSLPIKEVKSLKYYPEQPVTKDDEKEDGIIGYRQQDIAIVPTKAGTFTLPEIRIPWWNTSTESVQYAVIPAQEITAMVDPSKPVISNQASDAQNIEDSPSVSDQSNANHSQVHSGFWPLISALGFLGWMVTATLWYLQTKKPIQVAAKTTETESTSAKKYLKALKAACRNNDPHEARAALLKWTTNAISPNIKTLDHFYNLVNDEPLRLAIKELDYSLYSVQGNSAWHGESFWQLVNQWKPTKHATTSPVDELYPKAS